MIRGEKVERQIILTKFWPFSSSSASTNNHPLYLIEELHGNIYVLVYIFGIEREAITAPASYHRIERER